MNPIGRRDFLKGLSVASAVTLMGPGWLLSRESQAATAAGTGTGAAAATAGPEWKLTGSHWGAIRARVSGGKVVEVKPFEFDKHPT